MVFCIDCKHRIRGITNYYSRCRAERDSYTGSIDDFVYCCQKNERGDCKDFQQKEVLTIWEELKLLFKVLCR